MRTPLRSLAVVAATALLLAGCSGGGAGASSADTAGEMPASEGGMDFAAGDDGGFVEEGAEPREPGRVQNEAGDARQFITAGSVSVTVDDPRVKVAEIARYVETLGGHVQERSERGSIEDGDATASLVLRVPSAEVSTLLERLEEVGDVESTSIDSVEVTGQVRDLEARIRALEISVERLEGLLARAESTTDVVNAEQALTDRQEQLESLLSQQAQLSDRVALSTIEVQLWTPDQVPEEPPTGFWGGLVTGWNSLVATVSGLLLALGVLLPWLLAIGLVAAVVLAVRRSRKQRPAATAPPAAPVPAAAPASSGPATALRPTSGSTTSAASPAADTAPASASPAAHPQDDVTEPLPTPGPEQADVPGPVSHTPPSAGENPDRPARTSRPRTRKPPAGS